jgi:hypothetical protein
MVLNPQINAFYTGDVTENRHKTAYNYNIGAKKM